MIGKKRELETRRKDGSTFPCILGLKEVITNGTTQFVGFVRDITAEKDAMMAVEAEQNLLSKILDASFDSLLVINETGILQYVNEAAIKTFGWSRKEFLGKNINIISK
jgi:PAS domain-containing protein